MVLRLVVVVVVGHGGQPAYGGLAVTVGVTCRLVVGVVARTVAGGGGAVVGAGDAVVVVVAGMTGTRLTGAAGATVPSDGPIGWMVTVAGGGSTKLCFESSRLRNTIRLAMSDPMRRMAAAAIKALCTRWLRSQSHDCAGAPGTGRTGAVTTGRRVEGRESGAVPPYRCTGGEPHRSGSGGTSEGGPHREVAASSGGACGGPDRPPRPATSGGAGNWVGTGYPPSSPL